MLEKDEILNMADIKRIDWMKISNTTVSYRKSSTVELCNSTPEFSDILWHLTKNYGTKVFLLTNIKPELSDMLYNPTHFPGLLVCRIRLVPLY